MEYGIMYSSFRGGEYNQGLESKYLFKVGKCNIGLEVEHVFSNLY